MSATNFWNSLANGFMLGMLRNTPMFSCFNPFNSFGGFNNFNCFGNFGGFGGLNNWNIFGGFPSFGGFNTFNIFGGGFSPFGGFNNFYSYDNGMASMPMPSVNVGTSSIFNNNISNSQSLQSIIPQHSSIIANSNIDSFTRKTGKSSKVSLPDVEVQTKSSSKSTNNGATDNTNLGKWTTKYDGLIKKYANKYNVEARLVKALMKRESEFNPNAKSGAGAIGLMQLMPATGREMGAKNLYDPEQNIEAGVKYLRKMLDIYHGNKELAVAAYNAGPGNVRNGRIPQNGETPTHVREVMKNYRALA